jgi:hypothetical protein
LSLFPDRELLDTRLRIKAGKKMNVRDWVEAQKPGKIEISQWIENNAAELGELVWSKRKSMLIKRYNENLLLGKVTLTNFRSSSKLRLLEIYKSEVLVFFQYPLTGRKNVSFGLSPRVIQKIP